MRCQNTKRTRKAQCFITMPPQSGSPLWRRTLGIGIRTPSILTQEVLSMGSVNAYGESIHDDVTHFDTGSRSIGIDNRASACISAYIEDFQGPVRRVNRSIKGFGGERVTEVSIGTMAWKWCDNDGKVHRFVIPNSYYVPAGGVRLLSPQHWARTRIGSKT
jgi:hypothetical protein